MSEQLVGIDNFVRAETDRMFTAFVARAGGVNVFEHNRVPTPIDEQPVIRMNRDTLYSIAVVDISAGATVSIPDGGDRYVSVMVVNQDHYINRVLHEPGVHELTVDEFDTPWVAVAARVLVDPADAGDIAQVNALQDGFELTRRVLQALRGPRLRRRELRRHAEGGARAREAPRRVRAAPSARRATSIPSATCSARRPAGAACPTTRRRT